MEMKDGLSQKNSETEKMFKSQYLMPLVLIFLLKIFISSFLQLEFEEFQ